MKTPFTLLLALLLMNWAALPSPAQPAENPGPFSSELKPAPVLDVMQRVADWQLSHPDTNAATGWVRAAGDAGMMALAGLSGNSRYRDALLAAGEENHWNIGSHIYNADYECVGQTWSELYFLYRDPKMIAPMREKFDSILAHPSAASLDFRQPHSKALETWSWCDSLFMAPPAWVRLSAATGDARYLDFAVSNWWRTTDFLYAPQEHLFFRDSTFFKKREANGQKVFWSRGNGWVMAGLVRVLQYLPMNHPDRPRFEQLFKDMAVEVRSYQQPDGLWRSSLLDPTSYPLKETSGSAFFTYAFAWGVNQGLLDRAEFEPSIQRAWTALVDCVETDGKLTHVQPVGSDPKDFNPESTAPFGVGAFLLAGSEVYRLAALEKPLAKVTVTNPSPFSRSCETVELDVQDLLKAMDSPRDLAKKGALLYDPPFHMQRVWSMSVMDGVSSRILDSQTYIEPNWPWKKIFQVDLAPHETRTFYVLDGSALAAAPSPIVKTFARYVPERHEDFAWESDRIAHRLFGQALETWKEEPLTSSGFDVWIKRTRHLIVNDMYRTMNLFDTNGPSQDDYKAGKTRGDGGLGVWSDGRLYVSKNWRSYKIITTGPIRSEFELTYDAWDAGNGRMVSEVKRISIDAGSNLSRVESIFQSPDSAPLQVGIGLAERPGENVVVPDGSPEIDAWQTSTARGLAVENAASGWMTYWQPQDFAKGVTAVAVVLPKGGVELFTNDVPDLPASALTPPAHTLGEGQPATRDLLAIVPAEVGRPLVYYFGAGWDESGDFPDAKSWNDYVRRFAERLDQPLQ
ncbi:MAG TPA: glycoside hydrolase family 88 protein, partial [Verrucomicrobiae bacterium]|nr:glycoside hydrolase family 88 protein [Verrucomicrobiae bacterium]